MEYIELHDKNKDTFSHRTYELLLRICTEFENNCSGILKDNGYSKKGNWNIKDYFKISSASKLHEYEVSINTWFPKPKEFRPFKDWGSNSFAPLNWYQAYNNVKHNRSDMFHFASIENIISALGGLFVILNSQFGTYVFNQYQMNIGFLREDDGYMSTGESLFSIKYPTSWSKTDNITIDEKHFYKEVKPFQKYIFKNS
ncbi:hypothetical protein [Polaribacter staleyi]|uniref:hypothetical protein n=1 Tax=Polaribacter staleyi TaxID=2022337 RepID=UPI0031BA9578